MHLKSLNTHYSASTPSPGVMLTIPLLLYPKFFSGVGVCGGLLLGIVSNWSPLRR